MATSEQVRYHYDIDTEFFLSFLDTTYHVYSCAVWDSADTLETAQMNKLARLASYARIRPGDSILDIGCGWGGMLEYATAVIGAREATGLTVSRDQHAFVTSQDNPRVKAHYCSWDDFDALDVFDAIVCIGAFEHFSSRQDRLAGLHIDVYRAFFKRCAELTRTDSYIGLQTIVTARTPRNRQELQDSRYLLDHVFPGSALPTINDIQAAMLGLYDVCELRTIGRDYARTLCAWSQRLVAKKDFIVARYGYGLFEHYYRYFEAARRNFENGVTELLQVSLRKLPISLRPVTHALRSDGMCVRPTKDERH